MEGESETKFSPDPSSIFSLLFALELEGGTASYSVYLLPPSSDSTFFLRYFQEIEVK